MYNYQNWTLEPIPDGLSKMPQSRALIIARDYAQYKRWLNYRAVHIYNPSYYFPYFYDDRVYRGIGKEDWIVVMVGYPVNSYLAGLYFMDADYYFRQHDIAVYEDFFESRAKDNPNGILLASPRDAATKSEYSTLSKLPFSEETERMKRILTTVFGINPEELW